MPGKRLTISGVTKLILTVVYLLALGIIMWPTFAFNCDRHYHEVELERFAQASFQQVDVLRRLNTDRTVCESQIHELRGFVAGIPDADEGLNQADQALAAIKQSELIRLTAKHADLKTEIATEGHKLKATLKGGEPHFIFLHRAQPPKVNAFHMFGAFAVFLIAWQAINEFGVAKGQRLERYECSA